MKMTAKPSFLFYEKFYKKRLFISSTIMTLVLLVAITIATFVWLSATDTDALPAAYQANVAS